MAIKFVDIEPEDEPKPTKPPRSGPPPEAPAAAVRSEAPGGQLPFAKSEPKARGRKKPLK